MTPEQALNQLANAVQDLAVPYRVHQHFAQCVRVVFDAIAASPTAPTPPVPNNDSESDTNGPTEKNQPD